MGSPGPRQACSLGLECGGMTVCAARWKEERSAPNIAVSRCLQPRRGNRLFQIEDCFIPQIVRNSNPGIAADTQSSQNLSNGGRHPPTPRLW